MEDDRFLLGQKAYFHWRTVSFREGYIDLPSAQLKKPAGQKKSHHPEDLMARGIDAEHVDVVVNLNLPVEKVLVGLGLGWETKRPRWWQLNYFLFFTPSWGTDPS